MAALPKFICAVLVLAMGMILVAEAAPEPGYYGYYSNHGKDGYGYYGNGYTGGYYNGNNGGYYGSYYGY